MPGTRAYNKRVWNAPSPRPGLTEAGIQEMYRRVAKKLAEAKLGVPAVRARIPTLPLSSTADSSSHPNSRPRIPPM